MNEDLFDLLVTSTDSDDPVWRATEGLLRALPNDLRDVVNRSAVLHWFDPTILGAIDLPGGETAEERSGWLRELPFVESDGPGRWNIHQLTREAILTRLWTDRPEFVREVSRLAADHFAGFLEKQDIAVADLAEYAYHAVLVDESATVDLVAPIISSLVELGHDAAAESLIEAIHEQVKAGRASADVGWIVESWRLEAAYQRNDFGPVIALAEEFRGAGNAAAPAWLVSRAALLAARSLMELGRFRDAQSWLIRSEDEPEGTPGEEFLRTSSEGVLFRLWGDVQQAVDHLRAAIEDYTSSSLAPLNSFDITRDETGDITQATWETGDRLTPPSVRAADWEAWQYLGDAWFGVATGALDEDRDGSRAPFWPVTAPDGLSNAWYQLGLAYADLDDYPAARGCAELARLMAEVTQEQETERFARDLLVWLGSVSGDIESRRAGVRRKREELMAARARADRRSEVRASIELGQAYAAVGDSNEAEKHLLAALQTGEAIDDVLGQAYALEALGFVHREQGQLDDVSQQYETALALTRNGGFRREEASLLLTIADFELERHNPAASRSRYAEALQLSREHDFQAIEFDALVGLAVVAENRLEYNAAVVLYQEAIETARRTSRRALEASGLISLAQLEIRLTSPESAAEHYRAALELARDTGNRPLQADMLLGVAGIETRSREWDAALSHFREARKIFAAGKKLDGEVRALRGIAEVQIQRGYRAAGVRTARTMLTLTAKLKSRTEEITSVKQAAGALAEAEIYREAIELLEGAIEKDPADAELLGQLGWVLVLAGDYPRALEVSTQALEMDSTQAYALPNQALALLALGRTAEAMEKYRETVRLAPPGESLVDDIRVLKRFLVRNGSQPGGPDALRLLETEEANRFGEDRSRG